MSSAVRGKAEVLKATARSVLSKPYRVAVGVFDPGDQLPSSDADPDRQREVVEAFLAASREGDFEGLLAVLDQDVVLRADYGTAGASRLISGARAVAGGALAFSRLAPFARPALVNGAAGLVTARDGRPLSVMGFTVARGKIVEIDVLADPGRLGRLDLSVLDG